MRTRIAAVALTVVCILVAPVAWTSASFTTSNTVAGGRVATGELAPVSGASATRTVDGVASVAWSGGDVVDVERTVGGISVPIVPAITDEAFTDDLTVQGEVGFEVSALSLGDSFTCALVSGAVFCAGSNAYGQLGDGTTTSRAKFVKVVGLPEHVASISAGGTHACAVAAGQAWCWGDGSYGQLGNGSASNAFAPTPVIGQGALAGRSVSAVSAGRYHSCVLADGAVFCFGNGSIGALGSGSNASSTSPVAVVATGALSGRTVTAITAGEHGTCAVASQAAFCWGGNSNGAVGDGTTTNRMSPVAVVGLPGPVAQISTSYNATCAVSGNALYCWGRNFSSNNPQRTPLEVPLDGTSNPTTSVHVGYRFACARLSDGAARCWGLNTSGELAGQQLSKSTAIAVGGSHGCAIVPKSPVECWGAGASGQRASGVTTSNNGAPGVIDPAPLPTIRTCATGWGLTSTNHCAPGMHIEVSYTLTNRLGGWTSSSVTAIATPE